jgi:hypothetical protein
MNPMAFLRGLSAVGAVAGLLVGLAVSAHAAPPGIADFQGYQVWKIESWYNLGGTTYWPAFRTTGIPGSGAAALGAGSPPNFTVPAGALTLSTMGTFPAIPPYISTLTTFMGGNGKGTFSAGGGPGSLSFCPGNPVGCVTTNTPPATQPGRINLTQGPRQFGGTMRLLGINSTRRGIVVGGGLYYAQSWTGNAMNALGGPIGSMTTNIGKSQVRTTSMGTVLSTFATWPVVQTGVPWTTGKAAIYVGQGYKTSTKTTTGSDTRTPAGNGNITLVTGALIHWYQATVSHWGMVGATKLTMTRRGAIPTPSISAPGMVSLVMLVALGSIYVMRRRYVSAN